jgi:hypothetical protein
VWQKIFDSKPYRINFKSNWVFHVLVQSGLFGILIPAIESMFSIPSRNSWILVPSIENEIFVPIACAFSRVVLLNHILVLVVSLLLLITNFSPLEVVVF